MDGFKERITASLQGRLSAAFAIAIVAGAMVAGIAAYYAAYSEAIDLQDDQLRQLATLISRYEQPAAGSRFAGNANSVDPETQFVVERLPETRDGVVDAGPLAGLRGGLPLGIQSVKPGKLGWRIAVVTQVSGAQLAVGQRLAIRGEIARDNARNATLPVLLLMPLLMVLGRVIVRRTFQPMRVLTTDLDSRSDDNLQAIPDEKLPSEIRPFVVAINRLLARVGHAMAVQRRFVADAAHELRTPLTALSLQAERLQGADMSDAAKERLATLRNGITRSQRLVVQLLALARAQDQPATALQPISIQAVFRQVLEDTLPLAEDKQIDIGVAGNADVMVLASEADMGTLVKNLVGNAIRHTPVLGRIDLDVRVDSDTAVIQVSDTGPGIPPQERERVFEPFYRNLESGDTGSGLGLSIVKAIADRLGTRIVLSYSDEALQTGLCVQIIVPKRQLRS